MAKKKRSGNGPIYAAMAANIGIFIVKAIAAFISNSSAMFAEAIHSLSDTGNEAVLLIGKRKAAKNDVKAFEFGAHRLRYLASFAVAILLFFVGGVFAVWQSASKIIQLLGSEVEAESHFALLLSAGVLVACAIMEGLALRNSLKEARHNMLERNFKGSLWQYWKKTNASELAVVMAEDTLALAGLFFAFAGLIVTLITNNPLFDALGGALVGLVLIVGAIMLGIKTGNLLIGEALPDEEDILIADAVNTTDKVAHLINMQTMTLSEDHALICLKIEVEHDSATDNSITINEIERKIRESLPWYHCEIYIESDHYDKDYQPVDT